MSSYPTKLNKFRKWAKAMEEGATVKDPDYGKTRSGSARRQRRRQTSRFRRKRRLRRKNAETP